MQPSDPFAVIAEAQPNFSAEAARRLVAEHYGLEVSVAGLVSERDQNFRARTADGAQYTLKIANVAEDPVVTQFQIEALLHIERVVGELGLPVRAPVVIRTTDGRDHVVVTSPAGEHVVRVVSWLDGIPLGERLASPALASDMGGFLANLGLALREFSHPGSDHALLWDLQRTPALRRLADHVHDPAARGAFDHALDDFERHVVPVMADLRRQVIHNDFNADNVLVDETDDDRVAGVIDFGDMLEAPLVADVAIGASYLRPASGDPLQLIAHYLAAYDAVTPLAPAEVELLFDLVRARVAASVAILDWRVALRGAGDPYLGRMTTGETSSARFLCRLDDLPREAAIRQLQAAVSGGG